MWQSHNSLVLDLLLHMLEGLHLHMVHMLAGLHLHMVHMLEGLLLHMVQQLVQRVVKDMVLMMMKMKMMKDRESTMIMSMMRLACPSLEMHPKELKAPPVLDVHRGRSDQWTGTLQVPIHLGGESVTLVVHVKVQGAS
jgi:hypothetical protein